MDHTSDNNRNTQIDMNFLLRQKAQLPKKRTNSENQPDITQKADRYDEAIQSRPATSHNESPTDISFDSVWDTYKRSFDLHDLGGILTVATERVNVREFPASEYEQTVAMYRRLRHSNIVCFRRAYLTETSLQVVLEEMVFSLRHVLTCPITLTETQIGTLTGQVLKGLLYLDRNNYMHPKIDYDNILINRSGAVKLANQHLCRPANSTARKQALESFRSIVQMAVDKRKKAAGSSRSGLFGSDPTSFLADVNEAADLTELEHADIASVFAKQGPSINPGAFGDHKGGCFPPKIPCSKLKGWTMLLILNVSYSDFFGSTYSFFLDDTMWEPTDYYAVTFFGIFLLLLAKRFYVSTQPVRRWGSRQFQQLVLQRYVLQRHRFIGPWSRATTFLSCFYVITNALCVIIRSKSLVVCSGTLALINILPLFVCINLNYTADCLGITLKHTLTLHRSLGWMASLLVLLHAISVQIDQGTLLATGSTSIIIITASSLLLVVCFFSCFLRYFLWYEAFLKSHYLAAVSTFVAICFHLEDKPNMIRHLFSAVIILAVMSVSIMLCHVLYQNRRMGNTFTRALVYYVDEGESLSRGVAVRIRLILSRPIKVEAGQHIVLWLPRIRLLDMHPFVVTSWAENEQSNLELFVQPRGGFTARLLRYRQHLPIPYLALITGPHGKLIPILDYEAVVLVATNYGIVAQMAYLKKLVHGYNYRKGRTRRVRLVWIVDSLNLICASQSMLNPLLTDDGWNDLGSRALNISIYHCGILAANSESLSQNAPSFPFGKRAVLFSEAPCLERIIWNEASEVFNQSILLSKNNSSISPNEYHLQEVPEVVEQRGQMLIIASVNTAIRDDLRSIVASYQSSQIRESRAIATDPSQCVLAYLKSRLWLRELDYQPE